MADTPATTHSADDNKQSPNFVSVNANYEEQYGFNVKEQFVFKSEKGLNENVVKQISTLKHEPQWMHDFRQHSLKTFFEKPMPSWGADLSGINFDDIYYYLKPTDHAEKTWDDVPEQMKNTFERLGVPQAEREFLAGVKAQFDSEIIYGSLQKELGDQGVIFMGTDEALQKYPHFFEEYFSKVIPPADNKFAALNSAVWSGGSFVYVPKGVKVKRPLQAYFRINAKDFGQFERTLIIIDEGAEASYVEGCFTAGHRITTKAGFKNIEEISQGDQVLTHNGQYKNVYNIQKRLYSGNLYDFELTGFPFEHIECTEEHPILVAKRHLKNEKNKKFTVEWVPASDLTPKDYVTVPIDREVELLSSKVFTVTKKNTEATVEVPMNREFFRLIGYYLAEGSCEDRGYLRFSFSTKEREYVEDVKALVKDLFKIDKYNELTYKDRNGLELVFSSVVLARIFKEFGTSSNSKHLPFWIQKAPFELQSELVKGYYRGDGNYYKAQTSSGLKEIFRISTVSKTLAIQIRDLLFRGNIVASLNLRNRDHEGRQNIYNVVIGGEYLKPFAHIVGHESIPNEINGHKRATPYFIDEKYAYFPIKKILSSQVSDIEVYNFSVDDDESYVVGGVGVHNCTAPVYSSNSLHSAVVEVIVKKNARFRYTTIQNWSPNVYNLVTKRARVEENAVMEWVDGNLGSKATMKYPSCYLVGNGARGEVLSIAYAGAAQHQDAGAKMVHLAPNTSSLIVSKSVSANGGRTSYRGLVAVTPTAKNAKSRVECDALILDQDSASDTFPVMKIDESSANIEHEATVSKIGEEKIFYLMSRGLTEAQAMGLIVSGFIEPIVKQLPLEYAVELNRLIELEMEGSVG